MASNPARMDAGTLCLQFLRAGDDLVGWAQRTLTVALDPATAAEQRDAETLTAAMDRIGEALVQGMAVPIGDLARVNRIAAAPDLAPQLGAGGRLGYAWPATMGQLLSSVARDVITLLTGPGTGLVRRCAADDCDVLFLDTSQAGGRRWCSMQRCGNRAKVRAHRARRPPAAADPD